MKVTLLCNYFGRWPVWMPFFLESCRMNPDFKWIIYTDCGIPENFPENVFFHEITFNEYCERIEKELSIKFTPDSPYKLCDIKPALGLIHQEEISDSDFWGYSDIDVIYGRLSDFFTENKMRNHKLISSGSRRVWGFLCLIENSNFGRNLFKRVDNWKKIFEDSSHHAFDEKDFSNLFVKHKNFPDFVRRIMSNFYELPKIASMEDAWSNPGWKYGWVDGTQNYPKSWFWKNGVLTNDINEQEFSYLHFIHWKRGWSETEKMKITQDVSGVSLEWEINEQGIFSTS